MRAAYRGEMRSWLATVGMLLVPLLLLHVVAAVGRGDFPEWRVARALARLLGRVLATPQAWRVLDGFVAVVMILLAVSLVWP